MVVQGERVAVAELLESAEKTLSDIFPIEAPDLSDKSPEIPLFKEVPAVRTSLLAGAPRVFIPVMPGTNCEIDSAKAFEKAGAVCHVQILRNRDQKELCQSVEQMAEEIRKSQIVMFPGGFSAGDEPEGSGSLLPLYSDILCCRRRWMIFFGRETGWFWHLQWIPGTDQAGTGPLRGV